MASKTGRVKQAVVTTGSSKTGCRAWGTDRERQNTDLGQEMTNGEREPKKRKK